jgi:proliferating cell nuclear antigen
MAIIFKAKSNCAYTIKILAELLQNNIKTACFEIDENGIRLCMMDSHRTILINVMLHSDNFTLYRFKGKEKKFLGINLSHFHKMLKSIKKKDSMEIFIDDDEPNFLAIKVMPKENNRTTTSFVNILEVQNIAIDLPEGYGRSVIVPSSEYQKMCKDMTHIGSTISIVSQNFHIKFKCNAGGIMKRHVEFGETDEDDDDDKSQSLVYKQDFNTEQLSRITKMAGLSTHMHIYPLEGKPLLFKSTVGSLGYIEVYIKSKDLIEEDKQKDQEESDDESDDDDDDEDDD